MKVAESAVREAKSFTEDEALAQRVIDVVATDIPSSFAGPTAGP
jgi:membrane-bound ClpP family serine protease